MSDVAEATPGFVLRVASDEETLVEAPEAWTALDIEIAIESGLAVVTDPDAGALSVAVGLDRLGAALHAAGAPEPAIETALAAIRAGALRLDDAAVAALVSGETPTAARAVIAWPAAESEAEMVQALADAMRAGAQIGVSGAPSPAALDAIDAFLGLADTAAYGGSVLIQPPDDSALRSRERARARAMTASTSSTRPL